MTQRYKWEPTIPTNRINPEKLKDSVKNVRPDALIDNRIEILDDSADDIGRTQQ